MSIARHITHPLAWAALCSLALPGCNPTPAPLTPQTDGNFPQPRRFDARGAAEVQVQGLHLPGTFTIQYFVLPEDRAVITSIVGELEDQIVRRRRIFGPDVRIPMRCNEASLVGQAEGSVTGGSALEFPAETLELQGLTFEERGADQGCPGPDNALPLIGRNRAVANGTHAPDADRFGLATALSVELAGEDRRGDLTLDGSYTNRPPVARIGSRAEGLYDFISGGCPPVRGQADTTSEDFAWPDPPEIQANRPEGLEVVFRSVSFDPDGVDAPVFGNDGPRVDIASEQWAHWRAGDYRHLGRGWELPPVLFDKGPLHRVLLTVTDRSGARSQAECRFVVTD